MLAIELSIKEAAVSASYPALARGGAEALVGLGVDFNLGDSFVGGRKTQGGYSEAVWGHVWQKEPQYWVLLDSQGEGGGGGGQCRQKHPRELILPFIVVRKRLDDLWMLSRMENMRSKRSEWRVVGCHIFTTS
jgi:hypothetical protein